MGKRHHGRPLEENQNLVTGCEHLGKNPLEQFELSCDPSQRRSDQFVIRLVVLAGGHAQMIHDVVVGSFEDEGMLTNLSELNHHILQSSWVSAISE